MEEITADWTPKLVAVMMVFLQNLYSSLVSLNSSKEIISSSRQLVPFAQAEILGYDDCSKMQDAGLCKPVQHIIQLV